MSKNNCRYLDHTFDYNESYSVCFVRLPHFDRRIKRSIDKSMITTAMVKQYLDNILQQPYYGKVVINIQGNTIIDCKAERTLKAEDINRIVNEK